MPAPTLEHDFMGEKQLPVSELYLSSLKLNSIDFH